MRKKIVAGNWKMNLDMEEGKQLVDDILQDLPQLDEHKLVIVCPPFTGLHQAAQQVADTAHLHAGAQNCHQKESGAYTGEVSAKMVKSTGAEYVIIGHSERRQYFSEGDELLAQKTDIALENGLKVIFCCGEQLSIREAGTQNNLVKEQLSKGLFHLSAKQLADVVIAYEPVWAIGTGQTATAEQAQDMHAHIRSVIGEQYDAETADNMTILYGGSCKPGNAAELFAGADVDGGLIGGAALKATDFHGIIEAMVAS